jgi:large subunit ribosomal protein L9
MKVILKQDVKNLGKHGDTAQVSEGYARNYLFARNLAVEVTESNLKGLEQENKIKRGKQDKIIKEFQKLAEKIEKTSCTIPVKTGQNDKMFGQVNSNDIAEALASKGVDVDKKIIMLTEPIRELGVYTVPVKLYSDEEQPDTKVIANVKVWVVKE